ncbi:MAG: hypothetical protein ACYDDU_19285 [Dermatophilaceae bacterium]
MKSRESDAMSVRDASFTDLPRLQEIERQAGEVFRHVGMNAVADDEPADHGLDAWPRVCMRRLLAELNTLDQP